MSRNQISEELFALLKVSGLPVVTVRRSEEDYVISAGNILTRCLELKKRYRTLGVGPDDVVVCSPSGLAGAVIIAESIISNRSLVLLAGPVYDEYLAGLRDASKGLSNSSRSRRVFAVSFQDDISLEVDEFKAEEIGLCDLPACQFALATSGSSGLYGDNDDQGALGIKLIPITHDVVHNQIHEHIAALGIKAETTRIVSLPLTHAFGLILDFLIGIFAKQTIILSPIGEVGPWLEEASDMCLVPRSLAFLHKRLKDDETSLQILVGGAQTPDHLLNAKFAKIIEGYGMTECGPGLALGGRLLPGRRVRFTSLDTGEVFEYQSGSGPMPNGLFRLSVHRSNLAHPDFFVSQLDDDFWPTKDIVNIQGDYLRVVGREGEVRKGFTGEWTTLSKMQAQVRAQLDMDILFGLFRERQQIIVLNRKALSEDQQSRLRQIVGEFEPLFKEVNLDHYLEYGKGKDLRDAILRDINANII